MNQYTKPARHLMLAWLCGLLALVFMILTVVYAEQTTMSAHMWYLYSSSSRTIFVLSLLSGITGIFLAATIAAAFELLQWLLVVRDKGVNLTKFLGLQAGTGITGLLLLVAGPGHPLKSAARIWGATRLVTSVILVPVLGILIMSNVNTRLSFDVIRGEDPTWGWGMSPFNASLAKNVSLIADQLVQAQLSTFLFDTSRAVDITPGELRSIPCLHGPESQSGVPCERIFLMPGGVELAAPVLNTGDTNSASEVFLAKDQMAYVLNFKEGTSQMNFDEATQCQIYGFPFSAFNLCLMSAEENILQARIVQCPNEISSISQCQVNTSWTSNPGWTTTLSTTFRRVNIAYSKLNGSILAQEFTSTSRPAPVDAGEMLQGYRDAFGDFSNFSDILTLFADPQNTNLFPLYAYPAFVAACLKGVDTLGAQNPALVTRAADALQCLLAIMLYYCQPSLFARAVSRSGALSSGIESDLTQFAANLLAIAPPDTEVSVAGLHYQIVVGKATLIGYATISGTVLLFCLGILLYGSVSNLGRRVPKTTPFPFLDSAVRCEDVYIAAEDNDCLNAKVLEGSPRELMKELSGINLKLAPS